MAAGGSRRTLSHTVSHTHEQRPDQRGEGTDWMRDSVVVVVVVVASVQHLRPQSVAGSWVMWSQDSHSRYYKNTHAEQDWTDFSSPSFSISLSVPHWQSTQYYHNHHLIKFNYLRLLTLNFSLSFFNLLSFCAKCEHMCHVSVISIWIQGSTLFSSSFSATSTSALSLVTLVGDLEKYYFFTQLFVCTNFTVLLSTIFIW